MTTGRKLSVPTAMLAVGVVACMHRGNHEPAPPAPAVSVSEMSGSPVTSAASPSQPTMESTKTVGSDVTEPYIEFLTANNEDVRLVLQKIAEIGKLDLVIPGSIHKTISVRYVHVPVSSALKDVLKRSGLQLSSGPAAALPFDTVTVFYRLPANVDSLSVDGIMKRFGVGREIAELIVKSRPPER